MFHLNSWITLFAKIVLKSKIMEIFSLGLHQGIFLSKKTDWTGYWCKLKYGKCVFHYYMYFSSWYAASTSLNVKTLHSWDCQFDSWYHERMRLLLLDYIWKRIWHILLKVLVYISFWSSGFELVCCRYTL